jgi:hypothetical protein
MEVRFFSPARVRQLRQHSYFCASKASKLSVPPLIALRRMRASPMRELRTDSSPKSQMILETNVERSWTQLLRQYFYFCTRFCVSICTCQYSYICTSFCVSICFFVLVKQVN